MNRLIFFLIFLCSSIFISVAQENITVQQVESNYPIYLVADLKNNVMVRISFPLAYKIHKNTDDIIKMDEVSDYLYQSNSVREFNRGWEVAGLFVVENDTLSDVRSRDPRTRLSKDTIKEYVYHTRHEVSEDCAVQSLFAPYLEKMKTSGNHVLYIESIQELKKMNSTLPDIFLKGDSIGISFYKVKDGFYSFLLPVEVK